MTGVTDGRGAIRRVQDGSRWEGLVDLGPDATGRRLRKKVRGSTEAEVRAQLDRLVAAHSVKPRAGRDCGEVQS